MVSIKDKLTIRDMEISNRFGYPPMMSGSSANGIPAENTYNIYEPIAKGGVGLITFEATGSSQFNNPIQPNLGLEANIPAFKKFTDKIHEYGTKIGVQVAEGGILTLMFIAIMNFNMPVMAPSKVDPAVASDAYTLTKPGWEAQLKKFGTEIKAMTHEDIINTQDRFATAAKNAMTAGFDYFEIHSAHGTLFSDFLSKYYNQRTDEYGGSIENKCRFISETIEKVRKNIGEKPLFVRISADELVEGGVRIEDTLKVAPILEKAGIDCLDVSQGIQVRSPRGINVPSYIPHGGFVKYAEAIKKVIAIPVITAGQIRDPNMANDIIKQGKADIVYMGRQILVDPETPNKYFNGQIDDIKFCIGCQVSCGGVCVLNPFERHNYQKLVPTEDPKKVIILGAGIAGMDAARILKLRGHEVEIYEKTDKIGGIMPIVAAEYKKEDFINIVTYLGTQLKKLGVKIYFNKELTKEEILSLNPDVVAFAIGTKASIPVKLEGKTNVLTQDEAIMKTKPMGKNVVVWGLDTYWRGGAETVMTLREQGYNIKAIAGKEKALAKVLDIPRLSGRFTMIYRYFKQNKIPIFREAKLVDVTDTSVIIIDSEGNEQSIEADTFVYCGSRISSRKSLEKQFENVGPKIVFIGDCKQPGDIQAALKDGQTFAREI
jgi:2,4-dienoyl-CoA reductase-like NADH-dependent reductase (Old Yellow Enzyme family)/thioredoxin reductase